MHCVIIEMQIEGPTCPLPAGRCYWQHTRTKVCCYTDNELTVEEFCAAVEAPIPDGKTVQSFMDQLKTELRD